LASLLPRTRNKPGWATRLTGHKHIIDITGGENTFPMLRRSEKRVGERTFKVCPAREQLEAWVERYGTNSSSYVLLEGPKRYFTSPRVDGFLAYQNSLGVAVIGGDPICAPEDAEVLISDFVRSKRGRPICSYQVTPEALGAFRRAGFRDVQIGNEAVFDLTQFTLAGGSMELVRAATNKARREGVVVYEHDPFAFDAERTNQELSDVSAEWLEEKGDREMGFLLGSPALDRHSAKRVFVARREQGRIEGFIVCEPIYGRNGYYLDCTRRRRDAVRGTMELLTTEIFRRLRDEGFEMCSMGLAPLAKLDDPDLMSHPRLTKLMQFIYDRADGAYDFKHLYRYKAKYHPVAWERRYLCFNQRRLSARMLYATVQVRNPISLRAVVNGAGRIDGAGNSRLKFVKRVESWRHAASFVIGLCSVLLLS
jgi:phosphatidylglycerol lysyltransferase